jgi:hypothetical protein
MAKDHGVMTGTSGGGLNLEDLKEEEVLKKKRMEAKQIEQGSIHFCNCQQLLKFLFYQNYELCTIYF